MKRFVLIILIAISGLGHAQQKKHELTRLLFIFDASNSMNGKWESQSKISVARKILARAVDSLQGVENLHLALRIYGHQYTVDPNKRETYICEDTKLEVPFGPDNHSRIKAKIRTVMPKGTTPIALSLDSAAGDFPDKQANNVIVLITDGIEECDGDPCAIARKLKAKEISVKPFVVGIGIDLKYLERFNCIGTYLNAETEKDFAKALQSVISLAIDNTTAQINLKDIKGEPIHTNVAFTLYDQKGRIKYNYQHTMNHRGVPDTMIIDHTSKYDLVVHTIPPVEKKGIELNAGEHNIIEVDAPQGDLELKMRGVRSKAAINCIVRQDGELKTTHVQNFGETETYIVGKYDLEVLTLPRLYFDDIEIEQSRKTVVEVPFPGVLKFESYQTNYAALYVIRDGKQEWIHNMDPKITSGYLELLPGKYAVVYRVARATRTLSSVRKEFRIFSKETTNLKLE